MSPRFRHFILFGGFLLLLVEIRFEHRSVLDDWRAWLPILLCAGMLFIVPAGALAWNRGGRMLIAVSYCLTFLLGVFGLIVHSQGHLWPRLTETLSVWWLAPAMAQSLNAAHPPLLAPCALCGLGMIGLMLCVLPAPPDLDGEQRKIIYKKVAGCCPQGSSTPEE